MIDVTRETLLTPAEAAAVVKKHRKTVYEWFYETDEKGNPKSFWLESAVVGGSLMTSLEAINRYSAQCTTRRSRRLAVKAPNAVSKEERIARAKQALQERHPR